MNGQDRVTHMGVGVVVVLASRSSCSPVVWRISCSSFGPGSMPMSTSTTTFSTNTRHDHDLHEHDTTTGEHDNETAGFAEVRYRRVCR